MLTPSQRLNHLTTSIFSDMAERKKEKISQGIQMIDLSIGSPDLPPPLNVRKRFAEEVLDDSSYQYAIKSTEVFNEAVVYFYKERYNVHIQSTDVLQLMGSQDGLAHIALAYLDKGDVIIVPDPGYPIYSASAHIAGAEIYYLPLTEENKFMPSLESIPEDIRKRAKLMIMNYPGNPTAALADRNYFEDIVEFALRNHILILHDFAYSELIFDNQEPLSIFSIPGAEKTAIEFNSLSKSFNMAGARIGYVIGDPSFLKPLAVLKSHLDYGVFLPIQQAAVEALTGDFAFLEQHCQIYEQRRNVFIHSLHEIGWDVRQPDGGMFVWAKVPSRYTSITFSLAALEAGVVVTPGNAFGNAGEGYVRIALVQSEERLKEAAKRLKTIL
ncbi:LL-diaminopimelate aminotransferase [Alkalihalobacterium alkalinitrilicum]|uniref:LL-diaminopimelate aminotransferase n=1 Tax=Alkalihalobacterium alkalinitrilicum TaxID=427920 RepID=UPI000994EFE7|nr:LL-diaminopimelate aminotransferase [Alkalihalobacterium alkalinitrilicum]